MIVCVFIVIFLCLGSAEVCRECIDSGITYGHRKRNKDILAWAKKKRRFIKREELIAFLSDIPEPSVHQPNHPDLSSSRMEDDHVTTPVGGCCYPTNSLGSPRRRFLCREELQPSDGDLFTQREMGRKRQNSFGCDMTGVNTSVGANVGSNSSEFGPMLKRIKL